MSSIRLCVMDMAGTTVEDVDFVAQALCTAFAQHGIPLDTSAANAKMGIPKPEAIRQILTEAGFGPGPDTEKLVHILHRDFENLMCSFYASDPRVKAKPDAEACFEQLRRAGLQIFLDTGFSRAIAEIILERLGWKTSGILDGSITSDEVAQGRPAPDMIFKAMRLCRIEDSGAVAKVGDTVSDLQEGTAAGCGLVIGITTGAQDANLLKTAPHTHLCASLTEATQIILERRAG
ncbi:MAG: HAD hydrolase-like protein [Flavobacteriales bacterium]|nr:HAD hydrolase-like protein [Flavobacteriales bacterium]